MFCVYPNISFSGRHGGQMSSALDSGAFVFVSANSAVLSFSEGFCLKCPYCQDFYFSF